MTEAPTTRLVRMLEALGLDPALASGTEFQTIMAEVKQRCSVCQSGGACDHWLDNSGAGNRDFCPNARILDILRRLSGAD